MPVRYVQGALDLESTGGDFEGVVRYVHAEGIDEPIVVRKSYLGTFVPLRSVRGLVEDGAFLGSPTSGVNWTARDIDVYGAHDMLNAAPLEPTHWLGSLIGDRRDAAGLVYMRNRYYDPSAGRFTQEDPIGLAGGLNLYGFVGGDPVSFSDPFGLMGCDRQHPAECSLQDMARNFVAGLDALASGDLRDKGPGWKTGALVGQVGLAVGARAPVGQSIDGVGAVTVAHLTSEEGATAIEQSGSLRTGSFVTRPTEVAGRSAGAVESLLEIDPGRGAMRATIHVPADALQTPFNGPTTSGGAIQYQLTRPIPIKLGTFVPNTP